MAFAIGSKRIFSRTAVLGMVVGFGVWLVLVAGLLIVPLDKGESGQGIYALIGTLMPYETEDGERAVRQVYKPL